MFTSCFPLSSQSFLRSNHKHNAYDLYPLSFRFCWIFLAVWWYQKCYCRQTWFPSFALKVRSFVFIHVSMPRTIFFVFLCLARMLSEFVHDQHRRKPNLCMRITWLRSWILKENRGPRTQTCGKSYVSINANKLEWVCLSQARTNMSKQTVLKLVSRKT